MDQETKILWDLFAALGVGLLIGIERGWTGREEDEGDRVAGIRTFSLVGLLGGLSAVMTNYVTPWILAAILLALSALVITSYAVETVVHKNKDLGITTEIALILTFLLGAWATFGYRIYALGAAVLVMGLLSIKPVLHRWLRMIEVKEIYAGIKLLLISVVFLPLLPNRGYGPWEALNPYWIWWMVVLISGLSFIGYIFIKYKGERLGTILTSVTGGLASSTAVTLSLAQFAREQKQVVSNIFIAGVLIASSIMFIRVAIEVTVVNAELLHPLWIPLTTMLVLTVGGGTWLWKRHRDSTNDPLNLELENPLQLKTAIQFGVLLGVILLLATAMEKWYGDEGIYLLALFSGLMDVDAITLSLSRMAQNGTSPQVAIIGIVIAVVSNTFVKAGLFVFWAGFQKSKPLIWLVILVAAGGLASLLMITVG
ncbi:MgtC/SapB family protein [Aliifodinibius sp. S!AR15-10]|uniref:MgtC/SapB family protein n=1 Tax=Aliifodinibius sp. S!AR15-10 TaxID=2950437 RepID=UPI00286345A8|nr:MgtC/SapB family protein [Aliifodinibius sp. S!AR15-10]MDR8394394.1 MgtC/SapB family protein [Aliifodinibius sp. S!AR15-10]